MVSGDLKIDKLTKDTLLISNIAMQIKMRDGILDISPMTAELYRGLASNDINVDLRGASPKVKAKLNLQGFQIGDYLQAAIEVGHVGERACNPNSQRTTRRVIRAHQCRS